MTSFGVVFVIILCSLLLCRSDISSGKIVLCIYSCSTEFGRLHLRPIKCINVLFVATCVSCQCASSDCRA